MLADPQASVKCAVGETAAAVQTARLGRGPQFLQATLWAAGCESVIDSSTVARNSGIKKPAMTGGQQGNRVGGQAYMLFTASFVKESNSTRTEGDVITSFLFF